MRDFESLDPNLYPRANLYNISFSLLDSALADRQGAIELVANLNDWAARRIGLAIAEGDRESEKYANEIYEETEMSLEVLQDASQEDIHKAWMIRLQEKTELNERQGIIQSFLSDEEALR